MPLAVSWCSQKDEWILNQPYQIHILSNFWSPLQIFVIQPVALILVVAVVAHLESSVDLVCQTVFLPRLALSGCAAVLLPQTSLEEAVRGGSFDRIGLK